MQERLFRLRGTVRYYWPYLVGFLVCFLILGLARVLNVPWPIGFVLAVVLMPVGLAMLVLFGFTARPYIETSYDAMLAIGRCINCGYDISGMSPDPDGCTVCPECGAAWRLPAPPPPGVQ